MKKSAFLFLLALLCGTAQAQGSQPLSLVLDAEPGLWPYSTEPLSSLTDFDNRFDANGDGTADLILTRKDDQGNVQGVRAVDVASGKTLWVVKDVKALGLVDTSDIWQPVIFIGFADIDADGEREALFSQKGKGVLVVGPGDKALEWSHRRALVEMGRDPNSVLVGVKDMTGDGYPELILFLRKTRQVQVWSKP